MSPCSKGTFYSTACSVCYCDNLRCLCHIDAERHEETYRLLQCQPYGLCDTWAIYFKPERHRGWDTPDDKSWCYNRRLVPVYRDDL